MKMENVTIDETQRVNDTDIRRYQRLTRRNNRRKNNMIMLIKVISFIISIVFGGFLQSWILRPELCSVYIGASISLWGACTYVVYNAICRIILLCAGYYKF